MSLRYFLPAIAEGVVIANGLRQPEASTSTITLTDARNALVSTEVGFL